MIDEHPLVTEYRQSIPSKIENLSNLVSKIKETKTLDSLSNLRQFVHKLAGNSGAYGFNKVSLRCKDLDMKLQEKIKSFSEDGISNDWLKGLDFFIDKIKEEFKAPDTIVNF